MNTFKTLIFILGTLGLMLLVFNAQATPADLHALAAGFPAINPAAALAGLPLAGIGNLEVVMKSLDNLEAKMAKYAEKAEFELKIGNISTETKAALEDLGNQQKDFADELLAIKQKAAAAGANESHAILTPGDLFTKSEDYQHFQTKAAGSGRLGSIALEVKNTITNTVGNTFSDRRPDVVGGAVRTFTLEQLLTTLPTTSNAIDYVRENVFTNAAAEVAEGSDSAESSITFTSVQEPVATVAHWVKISRQLAADNAALAAYINTRMIYGVDLKVENQIIQGNGTSPNLSGFTKSGNYTAHGYTNASLTAAGLLNNRFDLIGKILGDLQASDYPADAIVLNPADWWTMRLAKDSQNRYILGDPGMSIPPSLFGIPVVSSNAITADNVLVASFARAATFYNRENVTIELSDSDDDNFTKQLVTVLASRRCALAVERAASVRYGDLTPA